MALEVRDRINDLPELEDVDGTVNLVGQTTDDQTGRFQLDEVTAIARAYIDAIVTDLSGSLVTAGTGDGYTVISARPLPVIADGFTIAFRADRTNTTAAPTLRVSGGSVIPFAKRGNSSPAIGDIEADAIYAASYVAADAVFLLHHVPMATQAPLASPALIGTPTTPTASAGTNTTQIASCAFVAAAIASLLASAPAALDTLNELAAALGNDPNFATTMVNALALKAPLASPALSGSPTAPTPTAGDNSTKVSTTAFVQAAVAAMTGSAARGVRGLNGSRNATTTRLDLAADVVIFQTPLGVGVVETAVASLACDIATAGPAAGGRDQSGAFLSGGTVHFYFIRKNDGTKALIASASASSTGPTLPSGYTSWAYATTLVTSGSALPMVYVCGARVIFQSGVNIVPTGTASPNTNTSASVAAAVPANALTFDVHAYLDNSTANIGQYSCWLGPVSGATLFRLVISVYTNGGAAQAVLVATMPNVSRLVWYFDTTTLNRFGFDVTGYTVPNGDS